MFDYFLKEIGKCLRARKHMHLHTHAGTPSLRWFAGWNVYKDFLQKGAGINSRSVQLTSHAHRPILSQCLWNGRVVRPSEYPEGIKFPEGGDMSAGPCSGRREGRGSSSPLCLKAPLTSRLGWGIPVPHSCPPPPSFLVDGTCAILDWTHRFTVYYSSTRWALLTHRAGPQFHPLCSKPS